MKILYLSQCDVGSISVSRADKIRSSALESRRYAYLTIVIRPTATVATRSQNFRVQRRFEQQYYVLPFYRQIWSAFTISICHVATNLLCGTAFGSELKQNALFSRSSRERCCIGVLIKHSRVTRLRRAPRSVKFSANAEDKGSKGFSTFAKSVPSSLSRVPSKIAKKHQ